MYIVHYAWNCGAGRYTQEEEKEASTTVPAPQGEEDIPIISETATNLELERVHEYDLSEAHNETRDVDVFTSKVAHGCATIHS